MKVIEHLDKAKDPLFSYEIVPPPRGRSVQDLIEIVSTLQPLNPPWIDVTAHASSAFYNEKDDGSVERKIYKKRPGTIGICGIIQNRFRIDTVAHLLCLGFTREETEDALIELNYLGIHNILALRGDGTNYQKTIDKNRTINHHASDLVEQIHELRQGRFLGDISDSAPLEFGIGVAGYPEKHFEAANLKTDILNLKKKIEAGADYIVTQMFFDNKYYFEFVKQCRDAGINVPIIPGLKMIKSASQLTNLPKHFHIDIPTELSDEIMNNPKHTAEIGQRWAHKQAQELLEHKAPCVHFYVMNDTAHVADIVKKLQK